MKATEHMLFKHNGEVVKVEIELTPLLAAVQDILGYWDQLPIEMPGLEQAFDYSMGALEKVYHQEVEALFRKQVAETGSFAVVEED